MKQFKKVTMDGNSAAAHVAYAFSEVAAIYPITPSSPMGEYTDAWAANGLKNIFGQTVDVVEMQSEAGAAGAVHGSLSGGAFTTTYTASQGLMLMLPNMHKIAGEMLPTVFHVSARSLAAQSLSIFGDHSDVMSARNTGFALMAVGSIQEIMDLGIVSHLATLKSSVPFLNFFDGFRNSHEIQKIEQIDFDTIKELVEMKYVEDFRNRAMNPENPRVKVGAQNPDVYFQGRETTNNMYDATPGIVQEYMDKVAKVINRQYHLFDYVGAKDADKIIIAMGSAVDTIEETINKLNDNGEKLGLIKVRLYRPFSAKAFIDTIPGSVKKIAVLDRTKEPGSLGEPLYLDVVTALKDKKDLEIIGGRYGLSSKEFTPSMVKAVYDHLDNDGFHGFTVGITDDVSKKSIDVKEHINTLPEGTISCKFWGLGSDGTVGANKNSIKIIGDNTDMYAQGYFQYDSKKSGGITRSHLRFGKSPIQSEYLITNADFIGCHNQAFIGRYDILEGIKENGVFLINSIWESDEVFENLTKADQQTIIKKNIKLYNINALKIANEVGLGTRINTVMQTAFFLISGVLEREEAIKMIKKATEKAYKKKGQKIVDMNWKAIDKTNEALVEIPVPKEVPGNSAKIKKLIPENSDKFTTNVIEKIMREKGDEIPVSDMPFDGFVPSGTTKLEKRGVSPYVPHWIPENCIQCNQCSFVCPHAAIRPKLIKKADLKNAPETFRSIPAMGKDKDEYVYTMQVYIEDCQGCVNCVLECPKSALQMAAIGVEREKGEAENALFFDSLPNDVLGSNKETTVKGSQFKQPLLEFSGACAGCGETPYVKLITQLYGDRMLVANATGCSSIWGGTFPTIPYCTNKDGHGPTWANSLFEDNAEYGFGMSLAVAANRKQLKYNVEKLMEKDITAELKEVFQFALDNWDAKDTAVKENSKKIHGLLKKEIDLPCCEERKAILKKVIELQHYFVPKSVWAFGGDGWAYDIGYGGVDHVMASGRNINILVLDTEVYSNTGGQASKATPLGSVAKFAEAGKQTVKKDMGMMMMSYGYVYVASIAMGANKNQALKAIQEAEAYDGPSIIMAYAPCINHGIDMHKTQKEEKKAVDSGYWLLYRFNPDLKKEGKNPFSLDSKEPTIPVRDFLEGERRYTSLERTFPEKVEGFRSEFDKYAKERYLKYKKMAEE
ncbi:MAG: pyruvate:ferredoxin (flavodoxin) oxidoreductase [Candidatus Cloacimonetes bacterium]|nr:pyruvate:ferredoxin (flavodoxin) oxidoreductase [Candidatus Cloacimonadota bacterium]MCF7813307.1 pyruvate:ferredoxin (flavodoxin) oxidoreductase [Candidatus Cloacimonadota bacterium]MCF7867382.1 pyruvate:ferredoxin (flavodoxin) oxidoreductase [Candidatus Cloacimonadota bacterium]MCF7882816.1 pyruvate:ferredoxin (flavodoxin) oxidoreductase [Candidatus Cloacimonadota bacterium]